MGRDPDTPFAGRTAWVRSLGSPVRAFLRTETGGSAALLAATILALVWANVDAVSYTSVWGTNLSLRLGGWGLSQDLRQWINDGLMTFFFLVMALEARREFDLGELRDRRKLVLPVVAVAGGMLVPIGIYLLVNAGRSSSHGFGVAMSTDTAFALGVLALVGRRFPTALRSFMLTVAVADDLVAFAVIATVYTNVLELVPLVIGVCMLGLVAIARVRGVRNGPVYAVLGLVAWVAILESGVDPVIVGVAIGLLSLAYPAGRAELERASDLFRLFREQPTSEYAQTVREGVRTAMSPNERLQQLYHPVSSYVIVPLFALANAGIAIGGQSISRAFSSPITLGIIVAYVVGKPTGIAASTWLVTRASRGRLRLPLGWGSLLGGGAIAGIGFTVSLLIATLAFTGADLQEAKLGVLTAALCASAMAWGVLRAISRLPERVKLRAVLGTAPALVDLAVAVDVERDHVRGPIDAPVTVVEYGDFECPHCGHAEPVLRRLLGDFDDLRYVWRHLPLEDVHPRAQLAAEASEAAAAQDKFWEMYDLLLAHQDALEVRDLVDYAEELGLDLERFRAALRKQKFVRRVAEDVESADLSGVSGTPSFFINGRRHYGAYDIPTLAAELRAARAHVAVTVVRPTGAPT